MSEQGLQQVLTSLAAGGGTFLAAKWILEQLPLAQLSQQRRFFLVYALAFALAAGAYGLQVYLGYVTYSADGLFLAGVTAFTASQTLWGLFLADNTAGNKEQ